MDQQSTDTVKNYISLTCLKEASSTFAASCSGRILWSRAEREREREREILFVTIYRFIPKDRNLELYVGTSCC